MDDTCDQKPERRTNGTRIIPRSLRRLSILSLFAFAGCSLAVMTGKMITGDPLTVCTFSQQTGVDLAKSQKKVLIYCTFPEAARAEYSSVSANIVESIALELKREGIDVVKSGKVTSWIGDRAGIVDERDELAEAFKPDFIIHIELDEFTHRADNSPNMFQGKTLGNIYAYKVFKRDGVFMTEERFNTDFKSVYPPNNPVPKSKRTERTFLRNYESRIATQIAQLFYNHRIDATFIFGG